MPKMYTLEDKWVLGTRGVGSGGKIYPVDDRVKTEKKVIKLYEDDNQNVDTADKILEYALSEKDYKEISEMNLSWKAYQKLVELVVSAMTGEEIDESRFQEAKDTV